MTTGSQFFKLFTDAVDQPYDGYYNPVRATRLAKDALYRVMEAKYSGLSTQKQYDELSNLLLLDEPRIVRNNRIMTSPLSFSNILASGAITTEEAHQLQAGDVVTISGVQGFTPSVDGSYTVVTAPSATQIAVAFAPVTGLWTAGTGSMTHAYMYADMLHPFSMKVNIVSLESVSINAATSGPTPYISFSRPNKFREGSKIRISGTTGLIGLDGDFWLGSRGVSSFFLFTDEERTTVPIVTGTYQGAATAKMLISEVATKLTSDRRISKSYTPTEWLPKYGIDTNGINIYPLNRTCESIACDYMRKPEVEINCADTSVDLELFYTFRGLMRIKDEMVKMYYARMRELDSAQIAAVDEGQNP